MHGVVRNTSLHHALRVVAAVEELGELVLRFVAPSARIHPCLTRVVKASHLCAADTRDWINWAKVGTCGAKVVASVDAVQAIVVIARHRVTLELHK